ncbi:hypothetical protein C8F04DRAFT_1255671 [Mycena alexandri]|uniref:Uncharacterized protein n=1 Tax=Mycena alexandri TaxID=1745969 RepID=A0AAD6X7Z0_9AGAR|nr:hypothetical protein C8F04DRAFT_1255671 [Mycena alexandri]
MPKDNTRVGDSPDNPIFVQPSPRKPGKRKSRVPGDSKENPLFVRGSPKRRIIFGGPPSAIRAPKPKTMLLSIVLRKGPPPPSPPTPATSTWSERRRAAIDAEAASYRAAHPIPRPEPVLRIRRRRIVRQPSIIDIDAPGPSSQ